MSNYEESELNLTDEYRKITANRNLRYTVEENFRLYPDLLKNHQQWLENRRKQKKNPWKKPTFDGIFLNDYAMPMVDIRNVQIREDWGQRNALTESSRESKIRGIAKHFDPFKFQPIEICYIEKEQTMICWDGGGRMHAAYMNGVYEVPAVVRGVSTAEQARELFMTQDQNNHAIAEYDEFIQILNDPKHRSHNEYKAIYGICNSAGFCLGSENIVSGSTPMVQGFVILKRAIRTFGGDTYGTSAPERKAPNLCAAIAVIKNAFPDLDIIPGSVCEALTAFIHVMNNNLPSVSTPLFHERMALFMRWIVEYRESDLSKWTTRFNFDSSNHYGSQGAMAFMKLWNEFVKATNPNAGNCRSGSGFYRYITIEDWEFTMIESYACSSNKKGPFAQIPQRHDLVC